MFHHNIVILPVNHGDGLAIGGVGHVAQGGDHVGELLLGLFMEVGYRYSEYNNKSQWQGIKNVHT